MSSSQNMSSSSNSAAEPLAAAALFKLLEEHGGPRHRRPSVPLIPALLQLLKLGVPTPKVLKFFVDIIPPSVPDGFIPVDADLLSDGGGADESSLIPSAADPLCSDQPSLLSFAWQLAVLNGENPRQCLDQLLPGGSAAPRLKSDDTPPFNDFEKALKVEGLSLRDFLKQRGKLGKASDAMAVLGVGPFFQVKELSPEAAIILYELVYIYQ